MIDSRDADDGIRRRRQCDGCGERFTTYEHWRPSGLLVVKKDRRREEFSQEKLLSGLHKACEKRPLPSGIVDRVAQEVEAEVFRLGRVEISSRIIGDMIMEHLKKLDYIAYIRFASVYRDFTDITDLKQEIDTLVGGHETAGADTLQLPLLPEEDFKAGAGARRRNIRQVRS